MKKQLKKTAVVTLLALGASLAGSVMAFAEQPKAAEYRNIINSGTYYIEWDAGGLAVSGNSRMYYSVGFGAGLLNYVPIVGMFAGSQRKMSKSSFYDGTKYYQCDKKDNKIWRVATEAQISNPRINPQQFWSMVKSELAIPGFFSPLASDAYSRQQVQNSAVPTFVESGVINDKKGKKKYDFDKYAVVYKNQNGAPLYECELYYYYDEKKGELKKIASYYKNVGSEGKGDRAWETKVYKITSELPKDAFKLKGGTKVYAPGLGDMADLLDQNILVEEIKDSAASETKKEENE